MSPCLLLAASATAASAFPTTTWLWRHSPWYVGMTGEKKSLEKRRCCCDDDLWAVVVDAAAMHTAVTTGSVFATQSLSSRSRSRGSSEGKLSKKLHCSSVWWWCSSGGGEARGQPGSSGRARQSRWRRRRRRGAPTAGAAAAAPFLSR